MRDERIARRYFRWLDTERRIISRQPQGIEVEQFIVSGDRPEDDLRKWRRDGGFAGEANAEPDRHKIHQCLTADIKLLHTGIVPSVGESRCDPFTQLANAYYLLTPPPLDTKSGDLFESSRINALHAPLHRRSIQARQSGRPNRLHPIYIGPGSATYPYYKTRQHRPAHLFRQLRWLYNVAGKSVSFTLN
jgi:hypothetical protein